jgi:hypothetical protein
MSLSEQEQQMLDHIARQLELEDPRFASSMGSSTRHTVSARLVANGALVILVGCLALGAGIMTRALLPGVAGFVIMGAGAYMATLRISGPKIRLLMHPKSR